MKKLPNSVEKRFSEILLEKQDRLHGGRFPTGQSRKDLQRNERDIQEAKRNAAQNTTSSETLDNTSTPDTPKTPTTMRDRVSRISSRIADRTKNLRTNITDKATKLRGVASDLARRGEIAANRIEFRIADKAKERAAKKAAANKAAADRAKAKTTTPKDNNRDNEKVKVPKKTTPKVAPKPTVPKIVAPKPTVPKKPDPREDNRGGTQVKPTIKKTILTKEPPKVERGDNDGGNNTTTTPKVKVPVIPKVDTAPTTVEVDQSSATDTTTVKEDDIYTRKKKAKARGRSMMTLTGPQGVKKDDKLTLGRPSLLGS